MQALRTEIFVEMQHNFAIGTGPQVMPRTFEFTLNGFVAVELAINDDPGSLVLACDRLIAGLEIDDAEPRMAKSNPAVRADPMALPVGAAVIEALSGTLNHFC